MKKRSKRPQIKNQGFTLVELMIAMAISGIVTASVALILSFSSVNYRNGSNEVTIQTEAQMIQNQLEKMIMEAYNVKFSGNLLTIYQEDAKYLILFEESSKELRFEKVAAGDLASGDYKLLGKFVESFQVVDTGPDNSNKIIKISIGLKKDRSTSYIHENKVTMRNRIKEVSD